jgi:hypothetical protein
VRHQISATQNGVTCSLSGGGSFSDTWLRAN